MNVKIYVAIATYVLIFGQCQHESKVNLSISNLNVEENKREVPIASIDYSFEVQLPIVPQKKDQPDLRKQVFTISTDRDTQITCKEGTTIDIPANAFVDAKGNAINGKVEFVATEYYQLDHILEANLSTTSGDRLLETGGMLNLRANANGESLSIQDGKSLELGFPREKEKFGMTLFKGNWNDKNVDWELMPPPPPPIVDDFIIEEEPMLEEEMFITYEIQPEYPGGYKAMMEFISENVVYPKAARDSGICGMVYVQFVIEEDGSINEVSVIRGVEESLDSIAFAVVQSMPKWSPGMLRGKPKRTRFTIPIKFKIEGQTCPRNPTYNSKYTKVFEKEMKKDEKFVEEIHTENVKKYILSTSKLGWINCDRFVNSRTIDESFAVGLEKEVSGFLVFDDLKSCLMGYRDSDYLHFKNVPVGENMTLVVIKKIAGRNHMAVFSGRIGDPVNLVFNLITPQKLKSEMDRLSGKWRALS